MTQENSERFIRNVILFTAPVLAIFFAQLATGVSPKEAWPVALYALYALLADYFKKMGEK